MNKLKIITILAILLMCTVAFSVAGKVWVESSSPRDIRIGYSGFEPTYYGHPGVLYINEPGGTRRVLLSRVADDPGYLHGDIYSEFACDTPKVIVYGIVISSTGENYHIKDIEVSCYAVRLPMIEK